MKVPKPRYELRRVYDDGTADAPEVHPVASVPWDVRMDRRGFLGAGIATTAALGLLRGRGAIPADAGTQQSLRAHRSGVTALAVTPDGRQLISGGKDYAIKVWPLEGEGEPRELEGHEGGITSLTVPGPGDRLVSSSEDGTVRMWSLADGAELSIVMEHDEEVRAAAVDAGGNLIASASETGGVVVLGMTSRNVIDTGRYPPRVLFFEPDGRALVGIADDETVRRWPVPIGESEDRYTLLAPARAAAVTGSGEHVLVAHADGSLTVWPWPGGNPRQIPNAHRGPVRAIAPIPGRPEYLTGGNDRLVHRWSLDGSAPIQTLEGHEDWILSMAVTPDGNRVATGDESGVVRIWDLGTGELISYLFDAEVNRVDGITYHSVDVQTGRTITYTLPCGSPIPPGAVCTCNCIPGTVTTTASPTRPPRRRRTRTGGRRTRTVCTCNRICTCIPVCQAHRLLHPSPVVRRMAEELVLVMGPAEFPYLRWAATEAAAPLRHRIHELMERIAAGARPRPDRWPSVDACVRLLDAPDWVVGVMAAQLTAMRGAAGLGPSARERVGALLAYAAAHPWWRTAAHDGRSA